MLVEILAVLFLHMNLISGKINIQLNPEYPMAKQSVTLSVTGITGNILFFVWFKGPEATSQYQILTCINGIPTKGAQYNSRFSPFSNASLMIKDLLVEDQGNYRVKVQTEKQEDADIFLQVFGKENISVTEKAYGSTSALLFSTVTSDSTPANFYDSAIYKNAEVTAGIISGAILGIVLLIAVSFLLYKRYGLHERKKIGSHLDGPDSNAIYSNILDSTTGLEPKDEPLYMCLQFSSEGTYNELQK